MKVLFKGTVPKDTRFLGRVEDVFCVSLKRSSLRIALSDGASESFDSKEWAMILTRCFLKFPSFKKEHLQKALDEYKQLHDLTNMSWSQMAAYERGSFATILGINYKKQKNVLDIFAIGDSVAVLLCPEEKIFSFPYSQANDFKKRPELLSNDMQHNFFFDSNNTASRFRKTFRNINRKQSLLLCMTDAIAEWAFQSAENGFPVWSKLSSIREQRIFQELVLEMRRSGKMRSDDTTLITVSFSRR